MASACVAAAISAPEIPSALTEASPKQQEADILDRGENQQALEAALREHQQSGDQRSGGGYAEPQSRGGEQPGSSLRHHVQLAEGGHIDDRDDQAQDQGRQFVGQAQQPEEERHRGQLDADAGDQQRPRPICLPVLQQQFARNQRESRDQHHGEVSAFWPIRVRALCQTSATVSSAPSSSSPRRSQGLATARPATAGRAGKNHQRRTGGASRVRSEQPDQQRTAATAQAAISIAARAVQCTGAASALDCRNQPANAGQDRRRQHDDQNRGAPLHPETRAPSTRETACKPLQMPR